MTQNPYDYATRNGVRPISWNDFHGICRSLAQAVAPFRPEIVLAVGRGGFYPGTLIAHLLQVEIYPVRVTRRVNDQVKYRKPQWRTEPPALIAGRRVLIVDEICSTGETIGIVRDKAVAMGVAEVRSAVMYAHTWGVHAPDYIGLVTDELLLNPWDREVFRDGAFHFNPEYVEALAQQGIDPEPSLLIGATQFTVAKAGGKFN